MKSLCTAAASRASPKTIKNWANSAKRTAKKQARSR